MVDGRQCTDNCIQASGFQYDDFSGSLTDDVLTSLSHDCGNHLVGHPVSTLGPSHHGLGPGAALILGLGGLATYIGYVIG